ncbi:MAG: endonuclease/exonuclease/phosphatase family protein, partial [Psychrobacter sp.]|nr:endonuclease/exonuclease/phosphatase family protein [Psychrobacter sp.]
CEILELAGYPLAKVYLADGLVIYAAHPPPPINRTLAEGRNSYLTELAALINKDKSQSILVVGDFNLSGFSPIYRHFIRDSSQNNSELHRATLLGLPTWLPLGIGIDQILVKGDSQKVISKPLGWQGSDHRGFVINWR